MSENLHYELNPAASMEDVSKLRIEYPDFPEDYFQFLLKSNGGEGFVGLSPGYFQLWQAHEVSRFSAEYGVSQYLPGYVAIGSSGGGELYVFSATGKPPGLFIVPAIGMKSDVLQIVATHFSDFISEFGNDWQPDES